MERTTLEYLPRTEPLFQWQYLRLSLFGVTLAAGWFCFSACVQHRFGHVGLGRVPPLRQVRDLIASNVLIAIYTLTAANFIYVVARLVRSRVIVPMRVLYLVCVFLPVALIEPNESMFGGFIVE